MPADWLGNSSAVSGRAGVALMGALNAMAQPRRARRIRQVVLLLVVVWMLLSLTRLLWALVPNAENNNVAPPTVINPLSAGSSRAIVAPVDIDRMVAWHLFGEAGATAQAVIEAATEVETDSREGIEDGARETSLQLKLRGIVASTEDGLGYAIIENANQQAIYMVEDKLPVRGNVVLAKVMPRQVVLDNGGTYELLVLFEESTLGTAEPMSAQTAAPAVSENIDKRGDDQATRLAQSYRQRLYQNPQSLAEVVNVSAVRENGALLGYRVSPGKDQEQFAQLGFKMGDVVTSVNGVSLDNPTNTMVLFNDMRSAKEAVFELQRDGQALTLSVNLDDGGAQ
ncbi:type II secretion system protein GspC [Halioglobus sp. Uisw_031]|uniref:type II secretion system protein GspC n=1 Tax=Halioglobus sp. Uisw_031 TaxID=3230977 RepID=UPI003591CF99